MTARDTAQRLVAREQAGDGGAGDVVAVAERALRRVVGDLVAWFGPIGAHSLLTRALAQARADHPALAAVRVGAPSSPHLEGLDESRRAHGAAATAAGVVDALASVVDLLGRLIGDTLAMRLLEPGARTGAPGRGPYGAPSAGGAAGTEGDGRATRPISDTTENLTDD